MRERIEADLVAAGVWALHSGAPAVLINAARGHRLGAHMLGHANDRLDVPDGVAPMIEILGNLLCPAGFDLGELRKAVILSSMG